MPNQAKCRIVLSIKSARCSTKSILFFGFLFFLAASLFFGVQVTRFYSLGFLYVWYYWINGYPVFIGIWSQIVGVIGICATNPRRSQNKCLTGTFGIFCVILIATESYAIYDFKPRLEWSIKVLSRDACDNSSFYTNCYFNVSMFSSFIFFAAIVVLDAVWCVICCLGSFLCTPNVQSVDEQQVPQPVTSQDILMEDRPPMYNPGLQSSTDNLQENAPLAYPTAPPMDPNMQSQGNATVPYPDAPPLYPAVIENNEGTPGNVV